MSADVSRQGRVVITTLFAEQIPSPKIFYLHDRALKVYQKAYGQKEYDYWIGYMKEKYSDLKRLKDILEKEDSDPIVKDYPPFAHRGIHDVESLFWVMTWTLLLVQPVLPQDQTRQLNKASHSLILDNMLKHKCWKDARISPASRDQPQPVAVWKQALGQQLQDFGQMMATLQCYFFFPWYRVPELEGKFAEQHGFELLRRQLLTAIIQCLPQKETPFTPEDMNNPSCIPLTRGYCVEWRIVRAPDTHLTIPTSKGQSSSQNSNTGSVSSATKRARSESGAVVTRSRSKKKKTSTEEDSLVKQITRFHKMRSNWLP
jgi:hypothetical protein